MNKYLKLVRFELNRFWNLYLILIGLTIVLQITGIIVWSQSYMTRTNKTIYESSLTLSEFLNQYGPLSFQRYLNELWFIGSIMICIVTLLIYVFFIWYRDWLGENTFVYRLLMLPTSRINLYLAKATTIFTMVLGLISIQIILLFIENNIWQWIVPVDLRMNEAFHDMYGLGILGLLLPKSFMEFCIYYGIGLLAVFVLFTAILFERSFRWKGIILGILYCVVCVFVFLLPLLIDSFLLQHYFYPGELLGLECMTGLIVMAGSIWTSHYLLKNKIRV